MTVKPYEVFVELKQSPNTYTVYSFSNRQIAVQVLRAARRFGYNAIGISRSS